MPQIIKQDDLTLRLIKDVNDIKAALRRVVANLPLYDISNENTPAQITASQNNYVPGNYDVLRLSSDAAWTITGFTGGVKGRFLRLFNVGSFEITISHQSVSSIAANRVISATGQDIVLPPNEQLLLYYDNSIFRWISAWASSADRISVELQLIANMNVGNASYTQIIWTNIITDTGGFFDVLTPDLVTIPETGWYSVSVQVAFFANATGLRETIVERNPASPHENIMFDSRNAVNGSSTNVSVSRPQYFLKGQTICVTVWQNSGGALDIALNGPRGAHTRLVVTKM